MKYLIAGFLLFIGSGIVWANGCQGEEMSTGWCYPTGSSNFGAGYYGWEKINPSYRKSGFHLAQDMQASEGDSVYAIADGLVVQVRDNVADYGGVGRPGGGIIIRHQAERAGEFDALYAHMKNLAVSEGDRVRKGQYIGEIGSYYKRNGGRIDHLHFGIIHPAGGASNPWAGYGNNNSGFVNPITFLQTHKPTSSTPPPPEAITIQKFQHIGWYPDNVSCINAKRWFRIKENPGYLLLNTEYRQLYRWQLFETDSNICYEDLTTQYPWLAQFRNHPSRRWRE